MLPPAGESKAERWLAQARTAAALDLLERIRGSDLSLRVHALVAEDHDRELLHARGVQLASQQGSFDFGQALTGFACEHSISRLAYFGGASAPLLKPEHLRHAVELIRRAAGRTAVVNNLYSTDWAVFSHADEIVRLAARLPTDNQIGWVLREEGGYHVEALPASAATRVDIDTPADLTLLEGHPLLGENLRRFLRKLPGSERAKVERLREVLATPGKTLAMIGRASAHVWTRLEEATQVWTRVFVEERGMQASGRQQRGEVRSLVAQVVDDWGPERFVRYLESMADGALWDTRVWMAHRGLWPGASDRYAADLGWTEGVENAALRGFTRALSSARIPIIAGGHGVVSGGVYALLETLEGE
jgi:hypothetical protein